nr:hypothetical protein HmN_000699200 [Hymenolepis microstoma]
MTFSKELLAVAYLLLRRNVCYDSAPSLASETILDDPILRQLWMECLPANMTGCLATRTHRTTLDELAEVADWIQELYVQPRVHMELPDLTDNSNPIHGDIHKFLLFQARDVTVTGRKRQNLLQRANKSYPNHAPSTGALNTKVYCGESQDDGIAKFMPILCWLPSPTSSPKKRNTNSNTLETVPINV